MTSIRYIDHEEGLVGKDHPAADDTLNRALRDVLTASGVDPDAPFNGLASADQLAAGDASAQAAAAADAAAKYQAFPLRPAEALMPIDVTYPYEDLRRYGAACDGITDDVLALNRATSIDGQEVVIPLGATCLVGSEWIVTGDNVTVFLYSGATVKKGFSGNLLEVVGSGFRMAGRGTVDGNRTAGYTGPSIIFGVTPGSDYLLENFTVIGSASYAIASYDATTVRIKNIKAYGGNSSVVRLSYNTTDAVVESCTLDTSGSSNADCDCIMVHSATAGKHLVDVKILNNRLLVGASGGFAVEAGAFSGDAIDGLTIRDNRAVATADCCGGYSIGDNAGIVKVCDNTFNPNGFKCSIAGFEVAMNSGPDVLLSGNTVPSSSDCQSLSVSRSVSGLKIISNTFGAARTDLSGTRAVVKIGTSTTDMLLERILIEGNDISIPADAGGGGTRIGIWVQCNNASATVRKVRIRKNEITGDGTANTTGINLSNNAGTMDNVTAALNEVDSVALGLDCGSALATRCRLIRNEFTNVTTKYNLADSTTFLIEDRNGLTFAQLKGWANGSVIYVTDGKVNTFPLAASGTGVLAKRINSQWVSSDDNTGSTTNIGQSASSSTVNVGTGSGSGGTVVAIRGAAGQGRALQWMSGTSLRMQLQVNSTAESGANAGSNAVWSLYDDAGALIDSFISVVRAALGLLTITRPVSMLSSLLVATRITGSGQTTLTQNSTGTLAVDATLGNSVIVSVTTNDNFTLGNPSSSQTGQTLRLTIQNDVGGAMGTMTFGSAWKQAGFVKPTAGKKVTAMFERVGTTSTWNLIGAWSAEY